MAALTIPSQYIDGDFYDFFPHGDRCLDIVVGDVMGKGVPAALLGAAIKSALLRARGCLLAQSTAASFPEPEDIIRLVHADVSRLFITLEVFATLCYARLDLVQRRITLVDCGHTKTIHFRRRTGICETLRGENVPLGFNEGEMYQQVTFALAAGDVVVFYSDGVTEARNAAGEFFGVDRLIEVIERQSQLEPEQLIDTIRRTVGTFSGAETYADDLTCVAVALEETEDDSLIAQVRREMRSDLSELASMRTLVRSFCQSLPVLMLDEDRLTQLELAVTEAASNIMRHAYQGRRDQRIEVAAEAFFDRVVIRLSHRGTAFDPATVRAPVFDGSREGGFGVYIIRHSVDEVSYGPDEQGDNCICLVKKRKIQ